MRIKHTLALVAPLLLSASTPGYAQQIYDPVRAVFTGPGMAPVSAAPVASSPLPSGMMVGVDITTDTFISITLADASSSAIGLVTEDIVGGLAWDGLLGVYFGTAPGSGELLQIDPSTGATTVVGNTGLSLAHGCAIDPATGVLYLVHDNLSDTLLYTVDKATAAVTFVGALNFQHIGALDFDPETGTLYGAYSWLDSTGLLVTIDTTSGQASLVANTHRINGLSFDDQGNLYATDNRMNGTSPTDLLLVDKTSGAWSTVGAISWGNVLGLAGEFSDGSGLPGDPYCFGDGTGAICPCSGSGPAGAGCANTSGSGAILSGNGIPSIAHDSFVLSVTGGPPLRPGIFFQGVNQQSNPIGDGIICSNATMRFAVNSLDSNGETSQTGFGAFATGTQALNYQFWYRDPGNTCGGGFNFSNGWAVTWL